MHKAVLEAYISQGGTYLIHCPNCNEPRRFPLASIRQDQPNPFSYECPCGKRSLVRLVGFRSAHRKRAELVASFTRGEKPIGVPILCTVVDISVKGMRISTDPVKHLSKENVIQVTLLLDNDQRTKLRLPAIVRRVDLNEGRLYVSVEFLPLDPDQHETLNTYMHS